MYGEGGAMRLPEMCPITGLEVMYNIGGDVDNFSFGTLLRVVFGMQWHYEANHSTVL